MSKFKRIIAAAFGIVMLLGAMPFIMAASNTNPNYVEDLGWSFSKPAQTITPFSGKSVAIENANLASLANSSAFSADISSWLIKSDTSTTIAGVLNLRMYKQFLTDTVKTDKLTFLNSGTNLQRSTGSNNVFVITNKKEDGTSKASFTSPNITLNADSYYVLSVDYYARDSKGSFHFVSPSVNQYIVLPQTSSWKTATFFVATDVLASHTVNLSLNLGTANGSGGVIYFQNPRAEQVSQEYFLKRQSEVTSAQEYLTKSIDIAGENPNPTDITDPKKNYFVYDNKKIDITADEPGRTYEFINNPVDPKVNSTAEQFGTFVRPSIATHRIPALLNFPDADFVHLAKRIQTDTERNVANNDNVMLLAANNKQASLKLAQPFTAKRHQRYMITFYSFASASTNTTIRMRDAAWKTKTAGTYFDTDQKAVSISSTETLNGWALNRYFLTGESLEDVKLDFEFWVGTKDNFVTEYILIDDFKIQRISEEYFTTYGASLTDATFSIDSHEVTPTVTNAFFNLGKIRSVDAPYPLKADSWTHTFKEGDDKYILSGIVNTQPSHWSAYDGRNGENNYGIADTRPGSIKGKDTNNNVYMLQNKKSTWQNLTSTDIALSTGVTNVIKFNYYIPTGGVRFWVSGTIGNREIKTPELTQATAGWQEYSFAITETPASARSLKLTFNLGSSDKPSSYGTVYIDNITMTQPETIGSDDIVIADLNNPKDYFVTEGEHTTVQILPDTHETLLMESKNHEQATSVVSTQTETVSMESYYEYRVSVQIGELTPYHLCKYVYPDTNNLDIITTPPEKCTENHEYGVYFTLEGFQGGFEHITHDEIMKMNALKDNYAELVFYIHPIASGELSLRVTFGDQYTAVTGQVLIRSIKLNTIDADTFTLAQEDFASVSHAKFIGDLVDDSTEPGDGTATAKEPIKWWIIAPSLIMSVTIIVAILGFLIRRFRFRVHIEKHHTSYASDDRSIKTAPRIKDKTSK